MSRNNYIQLFKSKTISHNDNPSTQVVPEDAVLGAGQSSEVSTHSSSDEGEVTLIDTTTTTSTHSSRTTSIDLTSSRTASIQEEDEEVEATEEGQGHESEGQVPGDLTQSESEQEISDSQETADQLDKSLSEPETSEGSAKLEPSDSKDGSRTLEGQQEATSHLETVQKKEASPEVDLSEYDVILSEELESVSEDVEDSAVIGGAEDSAQRMTGSEDEIDLDSVQVHERFQKYDKK